MQGFQDMWDPLRLGIEPHLLHWQADSFETGTMMISTFHRKKLGTWSDLPKTVRLAIVQQF